MRRFPMKTTPILAGLFVHFAYGILPSRHLPMRCNALHSQPCTISTPAQPLFISFGARILALLKQTKISVIAPALL